MRTRAQALWAPTRNPPPLPTRASDHASIPSLTLPSRQSRDAALPARGATPGSLMGMLCAATTNALVELQAQGFDCGYQRLGSLNIACTAEEAEYVRAAYASQRARGWDVQLLDSAAVRRVEPALAPVVRAAVHTPGSGHVEPLLATIAFAESAAAKGATVLEQRRVVRIEPLPLPRPPSAPHRFAVSTAGGEQFLATHVCLASGTSVPKLCRPLGVDVPVVPVKGQVWLSEPMPGSEGEGEGEGEGVFKRLSKIIYITESHLWFRDHSSRDDANGAPEQCTHDSAGRQLCRHAYGKPCADGRVLFGGDRIPTGAGGTGCGGSGAGGPASDTAELTSAHTTLVGRPAELKGAGSSAPARVLDRDRAAAATAVAAAAAAAAAAATAETPGGDHGTKHDYEINHDAIAGNRRMVGEFLPQVVALPQEGPWAGVMPFSVDGDPLLGELHTVGLPGLWLAAGFGPHGIMEGPGAAMVLAEALMQREVEKAQAAAGAAAGAKGCAQGAGEEEAAGLPGARDVYKAYDACRRTTAKRVGVTVRQLC